MDRRTHTVRLIDAPHSIEVVLTAAMKHLEVEVAARRDSVRDLSVQPGCALAPTQHEQRGTTGRQAEVVGDGVDVEFLAERRTRDPTPRSGRKRAARARVPESDAGGAVRAARSAD